MRRRGYCGVSPNLYERFAWSGNAMAMAMNKWANDGNGYVGNLALKPEVAHTISATGDWHGQRTRARSSPSTTTWSTTTLTLYAQTFRPACPTGLTM